jgi:DNA-binding response OmpR family regulator
MKKVLVVEDDSLMSRMYERVFSLSGFEIEMALDGEEGISKLKAASQKPDIILLDVMMPKMNGFDALKIIKADADTKEIPVIILTNLSGKEEAEKSLKLGAESYLVKSEHDPKEIVAIVNETLKKVAGK